MSLSNEDVTKIESTMILRDANSIQNIDKNCKISLDKSSQNNILKNHTKCFRQKWKENKNVPLEKTVSSKHLKEIKTGNSQRVQLITQRKFKLSTGDDCMEKVNVRPAFKKPKVTKSCSAPSIMKKTRNSVIPEKILNVKPVIILSHVASFHNTVSKNKISPVKKIILPNVSDPKTKTSVAPDVFHGKQDNAKTSDANKRHTVTLGVTVEDLTQPEYNSIMCTINKLKELEQQKVVTDISHLSSMQRNFLNGKISTALNFPLDEAIYKNLVDLSIDERQLPSTITRSKDPEPRQKDIVPKLANFFIPKDTNEICEAVHIKSRALKIDDNWNAFKISNRILEWKYSTDDID